jgi:hypothetical protein
MGAHGPRAQAQPIVKKSWPSPAQLSPLILKKFGPRAAMRWAGLVLAQPIRSSAVKLSAV